MSLDQHDRKCAVQQLKTGADESPKALLVKVAIELIMQNAFVAIEAVIAFWTSSKVTEAVMARKPLYRKQTASGNKVSTSESMVCEMSSEVFTVVAMEFATFGHQQSLWFEDPAISWTMSKDWTIYSKPEFGSSWES
jgi:hypothetical protein